MDDFHIHTIYSDGTDDVTDILNLTQDFDKFSITDHNNINACKEVHMDNFIPGAEFSCLMDENEIHLLGYDFDLDNKDINKLLDEYNYQNNKAFLETFYHINERYGFNIDNSKILSLVNRGVSLNKVNLSNILLDNSIGSDIYEVYEKYVKAFLPTSLYYHKIDEIIDSIKQARGYVLLAHPYEYRFDGADSLIRKLKFKGIDGIEVTVKDFDRSLETIKKYELIYSLGSDYHGKIFNKCNTIGIDSSYVDEDEKYIKNLFR